MECQPGHGVSLGIMLLGDLKYGKPAEFSRQVVDKIQVCCYGVIIGLVFFGDLIYHDLGVGVCLDVCGPEFPRDLRPVRRASYSASLFDVCNSKQRAYFNDMPPGVMSTSPSGLTKSQLQIQQSVSVLWAPGE